MNSLISRKPTVSAAREQKKSLGGKTAFITGATGNLGCEVAKELARRGVRSILQYNNRVRKACELELTLKLLCTDVTMIQADFTQSADVKELIETVKNRTGRIDFLIHAAGRCRVLIGAPSPSEDEPKRISQINQLAPIELTLGLEEQLKLGSTILYIGSPVEDANFESSTLYGESKRGLHHFAAQYSEGMSDRGVSSIYYIPGIMRDSTAHIFYGRYSTEEMVMLGQHALLEPANVARNIVSTLISHPVADVSDEYDGTMLVRRDGYSRQPISEC